MMQIFAYCLLLLIRWFNLVPNSATEFESKTFMIMDSSSSTTDYLLFESESVSLSMCPTLCDPRDCSLPGSSVHGILQTRILEWIVMPSSRGSSWPRDWTHISCISCIGRQTLHHCATWEAPQRVIMKVLTAKWVNVLKMFRPQSVSYILLSIRAGISLIFVCICISSVPRWVDDT